MSLKSHLFPCVMTLGNKVFNEHLGKIRELSFIQENGKKCVPFWQLLLSIWTFFLLATLGKISKVHWLILSGVWSMALEHGDAWAVQPKPNLFCNSVCGGGESEFRGTEVKLPLSTGGDFYECWKTTLLDDEKDAQRKKNIAAEA